MFHLSDRPDWWPLVTSEETMPNYQSGVMDGYRRCPRCRAVYLATDRYFYRASSGRLTMCRGSLTNDCYSSYYANYRTLRRTARRQPVGDGRRFGVEVEFIGGGHQVAGCMTAAGLPCRVENYGHSVPRQWKIVPDGSISDGAELVSPPLSGSRGIAQVRKACAALATAGATVDKSCGLHVHHDVSDLTVVQLGRLFRFWHNTGRTIDLLVAKSRRGEHGRWCKPMDDREVCWIESCEDLNAVRGVAGRTDRYRTLNVPSYPRQGTVEVRQHQGTVNAEKILAWMRFGQATITYAATGRPIPAPAPGTFDHGDGLPLADLLELLKSHGGLKQSDADYLASRAVALAARPTPPRRQECPHCGEDAGECECEEYLSDNEDADYCDCEDCCPSRTGR